MHWVADGQASAIGTSPAVTSIGALDFPVAGLKLTARPLSSTATHADVDGHWTCSSDWPKEVSTARGADQVTAAAGIGRWASERAERGHEHHDTQAARRRDRFALPSAPVRSSQAFHAPSWQRLPH